MCNEYVHWFMGYVCCETAAETEARLVCLGKTRKATFKVQVAGAELVLGQGKKEVNTQSSLARHASRGCYYLAPVVKGLNMP